MRLYDLKTDMPTVLDAGKRLAESIRDANSKKLKVIKILHGYGSTGKGGKIKIAVRKSLKNRLKKGEIKSYIPGEAFSSLMGFDEEIIKYRDLIRDDFDYMKMNEGITYVVI